MFKSATWLWVMSLAVLGAGMVFRDSALPDSRLQLPVSGEPMACRSSGPLLGMHALKIHAPYSAGFEDSGMQEEVGAGRAFWESAGAVVGRKRDYGPVLSVPSVRIPTQSRTGVNSWGTSSRDDADRDGLALPQQPAWGWLSEGIRDSRGVRETGMDSEGRQGATSYGGESLFPTVSPYGVPLQ